MTLKSRRSVVLTIVLALAAVLPSFGRSPAIGAGWSTNDSVYAGSVITSAMPAGDFDGDGFADIVLGVPGANGGLGRIDVYFGSPDGLSATGPDWTAPGEGGGFASWGPGTGDANNDGFSDIIVGAPDAVEGFGRVYVFAGGPRGGLSTTPRWTATGQAGPVPYELGFYNVLFGLAVCGADVDGDGRDEVIVGACLEGVGRAYAFKAEDAPGELSMVWQADGASFVDPGKIVEIFGWVVANAGDVNGDDFDDVIIGAPTSNLSAIGNNLDYVKSFAYVFHGSAAGLSATPDWRHGMDNDFSWQACFGSNVAPAGDMNKDGYDDILVAAWGVGVDYVGTAGQIFLYYGSPAGIVDSGGPEGSAWTVTGPQPGTYGGCGIGIALGSAGDLNGDGNLDIACGTWTSQVYIYYGRADGPPSDSADETLVRPPDAWTFASTAGDVNGDGGSDLLVGWAESAPSRADIYYGVSFLEQWTLDGARTIPLGGATEQLGFVARAKMNRPGGGSLQVEVQPVGAEFTGVPTGTSASVAEGEVASLSHPLDLPPGISQAYHWQARVVDSQGVEGRWNAFGRDSIQVADFTIAPGGNLEFVSTGVMTGETQGTATITVRRVGGSGAVGVDFGNAGGTAADGVDYTMTGGTLSWLDGDMTDRTFSVTITADAVMEETETVLLSLTRATGGAAAVGNHRMTLAIADGPGPLRFSSDSFAVKEDVGGVTASIVVQRVGGKGGAVGVTFGSIGGGSATSGADYSVAAGQISWADGETADKTFIVTIWADTVAESTETVKVSLSDPTGGAGISGVNPATLSIADSSGTLQFASSGVFSAIEGESVPITVKRVGGKGGAVGVSFGDFGAGSATPASDYLLAPGTLAWADGDISDKTFNVTITADALGEGEETVLISLTSATGSAVIGIPNPATLTIAASSAPGRGTSGGGGGGGCSASGIPEGSILLLALTAALVGIMTRR